MKTIRVANAGGFWGDDSEALFRQVANAGIDYLTLDFLAETTMGILQKIRSKDPRGGFAHDFIAMCLKCLPLIEQKGIRLVTNAGGLNPMSCAEILRDGALKLGTKPKIAVVTGDDLAPEWTTLRSSMRPFALDPEKIEIPKLPEKVIAANVYLGATPIAEALKMGANIVITGRVVDSALTLGPLIFEMGWDLRDWDRLAAGVVAGHLLECGAQVSGGNFSDWRTIPSFDDIGFPIAEVSDSGVFEITKTPNSGGAVTVNTVKEQLLYEIDDPKAYITPDVVADFTSIKLTEVCPDRIRVEGIKGFEPTSELKVTVLEEGGFKCSGMLFVSGPDALEKAKVYGDIFWRRVPKVEEHLTEYLGHKALQAGWVTEGLPSEVVMRLSARDTDEKKLKTFSKMLPAFALAGPPGITMAGGIPRPDEIVGYIPAMIPKEKVSSTVYFLHDHEKEDRKVPPTEKGNFVSLNKYIQAEKATSQLGAAGKGKKLSEFCLARSGDKGNAVNIGVIARSDSDFQFLKKYLTAQRVKDLFQEKCLGWVRRYEVENLRALNFVLDRALGGGGMRSLRADALGKCFAQTLLQHRVENA